MVQACVHTNIKVEVKKLTNCQGAFQQETSCCQAQILLRASITVGGS